MVCRLKRLHRFFRTHWRTLLLILTTRSVSNGCLLSVSRNVDTFWQFFTPSEGELSGSLVPVRQLDMNEVYMSKVKDEMRVEYRREDLGKGVRGKYFARVSKGTNLVLLDDRVAKSFPTGEAVNQALLGLLELTEQTARITGRSNLTTRKRAAV